jgi:hypothetical protein
MGVLLSCDESSTKKKGAQIMETFPFTQAESHQISGMAPPVPPDASAHGPKSAAHPVWFERKVPGDMQAERNILGADPFLRAAGADTDISWAGPDTWARSFYRQVLSACSRK